MTPANAATPGTTQSVLKLALLAHAPLYRKALFFSIAYSLMVLAPTLFMLEVYDRVINSRSNTTLVMLLLLVIGAYVVMEMLDVVRGEIMSKAGIALDESLRARLFDNAFEYTLRSGGVAGNQVFNDIKTVREFLSSPALMALMDTPSSLIFLVIVFLIGPWLGVMALIGALIQVVIAVRTEKSTMPALTEANRSAILAQNYAAGALRNTQVIEAMGMMGNIRERWMVLQRGFIRQQALASDRTGLNTAASKFLTTAQGSLLLGASCWLSLKGALAGGGGMMIVASTLGARLLTPIAQLVGQWRTVVNARDAYRRLDAMLGNMPVPKPPMPLPAPKGLLTVEGVVAGAPGSPTPILRGVNFAARPGELLVVIGPSAAGKTTLARLLTGIWPASAGKVRMDSADVFLWDKDQLGPHIGYLPQGVELFDGTVAENIARFGRVDPDKVAAAAAMVGLEPLIAALPQGLDTPIGEEGAFLSGGQRQRVAIARAVYGLPRFIVLDEPNASLDEAGEAALLSTLRQLKAAGCTIIVITHRTSLLSEADRLLMLQEGQVVAFGPRDEVIAALTKAAQSQAAAAQAAAKPPAAAPAAATVALAPPGTASAATTASPTALGGAA